MVVPPPVAPAPASAQPRPRSGCLTALLVVGALFAALLIAAAIGVAIFLRSDTGQKVTGAMGKSMKMMMDAQKAPGAREILKAGCKQGMVMDFRESVETWRPLFPDAGDDPSTMPFKTMVYCSCDFFGTPPTCDAVKDAYLGAVRRPSDPFVVTVQRTGERRARCMRLYDPDGVEMREIDAGTP